MFETRCVDGVCRLGHEGARWLATGWDGGYRTADAAFNVSVPTGFERTDLDDYARERLSVAGFERAGPVLLTGVDLVHARGARAGSVTVVATVGLSNPASLPVENGQARAAEASADDQPPVGTVNLLVGTTRALEDGTLATLLATAVEAKAATLQSLTGFTGTTSDALAVGCDPGGDPMAFAGSGTEVGSAVRACVRDTVTASLRARYTDTDLPLSVADAAHGVVTDRETEPFQP
ncbi:adenosylcobinamide amidohydrolase [Salinibaculum rarum]|uniref:adenosylcobinamide amidohydrolase n=1 Tax=Salinibaculum rarum TaxID=3058903 RepID=UPI00265E20A0|nr:adenosylcobinamide amidohydrolase [Salinibaculum sp. KK48]